MTEDELVGVLPSAERAGVYRLPCTSADTVEAAAARIGFRVFRADLRDCVDKAGLLTILGEKLAFPEWFGHNWDALADCLADMSWAPARGYVILLEGAERFRVAAAADFAVALDVFAEATSDWAADKVPMWIFINADDSRLSRL